MNKYSPCNGEGDLGGEVREYKSLFLEHAFSVR